MPEMKTVVPSTFYVPNNAENAPLHYLARHPSLPKFMPFFKNKLIFF